jgi:hypothetical protein
VAERYISAVEARGGPFVEAVEATRMPMVVTDPNVIDNSSSTPTAPSWR